MQAEGPFEYYTCTMCRTEQVYDEEQDTNASHMCPVCLETTCPPCAAAAFRGDCLTCGDEVGDEVDGHGHPCARCLETEDDFACLRTEVVSDPFAPEEAMRLARHETDADRTWTELCTRCDACRTFGRMLRRLDDMQLRACARRECVPTRRRSRKDIVEDTRRAIKTSMDLDMLSVCSTAQ